jgi:uncharacterized protein YbjT (DUF2867 family)
MSRSVARTGQGSHPEDPPAAIVDAPVLVTGASGFVGRRLTPVLQAVGYPVRCVTRDVPTMRRRWPDRTWLQADLRRPDDLERALGGCRVAYFLVHSLGESPVGLVERERALAETFLLAAERAGVERIVYLGGMAPQGQPSEHLRSRLEVGRMLRSGSLPALELRAAMIVGFGSVSWRIVRDLAARLPAMVLPVWLRTRSQPVAIDDVILALATAARLPLTRSASFDLPGPDVLSYDEVLRRTARLLGHRRVPMLEVPVRSSNLSSQWVRLVTRADWPVARELVLGLTHDLLARSDKYWQLMGHLPLLTFDQAARRALEEEARKRHIPPSARALEATVTWLAGGAMLGAAT